MNQSNRLAVLTVAFKQQTTRSDLIRKAFVLYCDSGAAYEERVWLSIVDDLIALKYLQQDSDGKVEITGKGIRALHSGHEQLQKFARNVDASLRGFT